MRLSIARSLRWALTGLTVALVAVATGGVVSLYHSRQRYEASLVRTSELAQATVRRLAGSGRLATGVAAGGPREGQGLLATEIQARQRALERQASRRARTDSRRAIGITIATGGGPRGLRADGSADR